MIENDRVHGLKRRRFGAGSAGECMERSGLSRKRGSVVSIGVHEAILRKPVHCNRLCGTYHCHERKRRSPSLGLPIASFCLFSQTALSSCFYIEKLTADARRIGSDIYPISASNAVGHAEQLLLSAWERRMKASRRNRYWLPSSSVPFGRPLHSICPKQRASSSQIVELEKLDSIARKRTCTSLPSRIL